MYDIKVRDWCDEALSGYGKNLVPDVFTPVPTDLDFTYETKSASLDLGEQSSGGFLVCSQRALVLEKMERHVETMEVLVSLKGDSILCLALPGDSPNEETIRAVRFPQGKALAMLPGTWHWIPYALQDEPSQCLVIFKGGTGDDDLQMANLNSRYHLV